MWRATKKNRVVRVRARASWAGLTLAAMLLLLPTMAPVCETEPNNDVGTANLIRPDEFVDDGEISVLGDSDFWRAGGAVPGDLIFAYVDTQNSTNGFDSRLLVLANDGTTLIERDDSDGPGFGSVVAGAIVPQAGTVFYEVFEDGDNDTITPYQLYQAVIDPADTASEVEGNDSAATANLITARIMSGNVSGADVDFFQFFAPANAPVVVIMDDDPDDNTNLTDTELDIMDTNGTTVLAVGDDLSLFNGNGAGAVEVVSDGIYFVRVKDGSGGTDSDYRFIVLVNGVVYVDTDHDGVPGPLLRIGYDDFFRRVYGRSAEVTVQNVSRGAKKHVQVICWEPGPILRPTDLKRCFGGPRRNVHRHQNGLAGQYSLSGIHRIFGVESADSNCGAHVAVVGPVALHGHFH